MKMNKQNKFLSFQNPLQYHHPEENVISEGTTLLEERVVHVFKLGGRIGEVKHTPEVLHPTSTTSFKRMQSKTIPRQNVSLKETTSIPSTLKCICLSEELVLLCLKL